MCGSTVSTRARWRVDGVDPRNFGAVDSVDPIRGVGSTVSTGGLTASSWEGVGASTVST